MNKFYFFLCFFYSITFAGFSKADFLNSYSYKAPLGDPCYVNSKYKINNGNWSIVSETTPYLPVTKHDTIILNPNDSISLNINWSQVHCMDYFFTPPQWFFNGTILEGETFNGPILSGVSSTTLTAKDSGDYRVSLYLDDSRQLIYTHIFHIIKPAKTTDNKLSCSLYSKYSINGTWSNAQKSEFHTSYFSFSDTINLNSSDTVTINIFKDGPDCGNQSLNPITSCHWYFNDTIPIEGVSTGIYKTNVPGSYKVVYGYFPNQYIFNYHVIKNSGGTSTIPECKLYSQYQVNGIWSSPLPCSFNGSFHSSSLISLGLTDSVNIRIYTAGPACGNQDTNSVLNKGYFIFNNSTLPVQSNLFTTNIPGNYYFNYTDGNNSYHLNFNIQKPSGNIDCYVYSQFTIKGIASTPSIPHFNSNLGYFVDTISINLPQSDTVLLSVYRQGNHCLSGTYLDVCKWSFFKSTSPIQGTYSVTETSTSFKAVYAGYYTVVYGYSYAVTFHVNGTIPNEFPYATINAGPDQTYCKNSNIQLAGTVSGSNNITWMGGFGSFLPDRNTLNATYVPSSADIAAGSINLSLSAISNYINESSEDNIKLTFLPTPIISAGTDQTVSGITPVNLNGSVSGSATTGTWTSLGSGSFSPNNSILNAVYTPSTGDASAEKATLILTSTGGICTNSDTLVITINVSAGLTGNSSSDFFKIFPNPTSSQLYIDLTPMKKNISITLYNTLGEKQLEKILDAPSSIDMQNLNKGLYYLILSTGQEQRVVKVVKE
jgi:hypothetical protein